MAWITQLANKRSGFSNLIDRDLLPPSSSSSSLYFDGCGVLGVSVDCSDTRLLDSLIDARQSSGE